MSLVLPGHVVALEGIDGSGKTTVSIILEEYLRKRGFNVYLLKSSDLPSLAIDSQIRAIVTSPNSNLTYNAETFLYFASLAQRVNEYVLPALQEQKVVIADRFTLSTLVLTHHGRGQDKDLITRMLRLATGGIEPILTILCDLEETVALARLQSRNRPLTRREREGLAFLKVLRKGYLMESQSITHKLIVIRTDQLTLGQMSVSVNDILDTTVN